MEDRDCDPGLFSIPNPGIACAINPWIFGTDKMIFAQ